MTEYTVRVWAHMVKEYKVEVSTNQEAWDAGRELAKNEDMPDGWRITNQDKMVVDIKPNDT
jgi:hypothetical protein